MPGFSRTVFAAGVILLLGTVSGWAGEGQSYRLQISGLACPFCVYGLEKELKSRPGVEAARVDLKNGTATVQTSESASFDEAIARRLVSDAGFTLKGFERLESTAGD